MNRFRHQTAQGSYTSKDALQPKNHPLQTISVEFVKINYPMWAVLYFFKERYFIPSLESNTD